MANCIAHLGGDAQDVRLPALPRRETRRSLQAGEPEKKAALRLKAGGYYSQWVYPERLLLLVWCWYQKFRGEI